MLRCPYAAVSMVFSVIVVKPFSDKVEIRIVEWWELVPAYWDNRLACQKLVNCV